MKKINILQRLYYDIRYRLFCFSQGITLHLFGDEIIWLWPCNRDSMRMKWVSTGFESTFPTLKAIKHEWELYERAMSRCNCDEYDKNNRIIASYIQMGCIHGMKDYDGDQFRYCPWCGRTIRNAND